MLSDEDCLRKLSAQVLNEASHLTQLNCVLNTLKKIRWKHLKFDTTSIQDQLNEDLTELPRQEEINSAVVENQLNYILDVIRDVFVQHKFQISDQLNEVHKLMSISSDDDLLAHLQDQNFELHQEINKLKAEQQLWINKEKKMLNAASAVSSANNNYNNVSKCSGNTGPQLRKFGTTSFNSTEKKLVLIGGKHHHILTGTFFYK